MEVEIIHPSYEKAIGPIAAIQLNPVFDDIIFSAKIGAGFPYIRPAAAIKIRGISLIIVAAFCR